MRAIASPLLRTMIRHRGLVTVLVLAAMLLNVTVVGRLDPPEAESALPIAARCQGGGPGCAEQPLIPPPVGGLPRFDAPPAPAFGALVVVEPSAAPAVLEAPPHVSERPPTLATAL
jgi:hypothetical protein